MTALENVRNFIIIIYVLGLIVSFLNDGKLKTYPTYCFKRRVFDTILAFVIYYYLGLFS